MPLQSHSVRSRLVMDMQSKTISDFFRLASKNFELAYSASTSPEDLMLLILGGKSLTYAEFCIHVILGAKFRIMYGLVKIGERNLPEVLEAWDEANDLYREHLITTAKDISREEKEKT